jgi:putative peptide zinc metalloprotease protein
MHTTPTLPTPERSKGTELVGPYKDSGLKEPTFLVRTADGQMIQLSELLYCVLRHMNGSRTTSEIADLVSKDQRQPVSAQNIEYLIERKLLPVGLIATSGAASTSSTEAAPLRSPSDILVLKARRTILAARQVRRITTPFTALFHPLVVAALLTALVVGDVGLFLNTSVQSTLVEAFGSSVAIIGAMALSIASMLFHEIGHAAACRYGGATPGKIGFGLYIVWPAFYTDVTDSYRLDRPGRLRVDFGGVYFNAVFALVLLFAYTLTGESMMILALLLIHTEIAQQLLPTLRLDGHLILADTIGVPDLFSRIGPVLASIVRPKRRHPLVQDMRPRVRNIVFLWVCGTTIFITAELIWLVLYGPELAQTFVSTLGNTSNDLVRAAVDLRPLEVIVGLLATLTLLLPAIGLTYVLVASIRQLAWLAVGRRKAAQINEKNRERENT